MQLGCFAANFVNANNTLAGGRFTTRRVFDPWLPALGQEEWRDTPEGVDALWSLKAPPGSNSPDGRDWQGAANGDYDAQYDALFGALVPGMRVAVAHEFETKMSAQLFHDMTVHLLERFRAHAPEGTQFGIISDHWQYDPAHSTGANYQSDAECAITRTLLTNTNSTLNVDFAGIDVYAGDGRAMVAFNVEPGYVRWKEQIGKYAQRRLLGERGITAETAETRANLLIQDARAAADEKLDAYHYWHSDGPAGNNLIADTKGKQLMNIWAAGLSRTA